MEEPWIYPDERHSTAESRYLAIGRNRAGKYVFVAFTFRTRGGERLVRPISARYMHDKEVRHYEQQRKNSQTPPRTQDGPGG